MFQRLFVALGVLALWLVPVAAQNDTRTYRSEDGAVQFSYSEEWTLETQEFTFNTLYQFALLTPAYNPFLPAANRSQIFIELINSETNEYARNFETAADFADHTIDSVFGITVELEETKIADYPAVRSALIPIPGGERTARIYVILRDDGWAVVAIANTPLVPPQHNHNDFEHAETEMLSILASIEFDVTAAAIPFERNLEVYDTSNAILDAHYASDDSSFSLDYSTDWEVEDNETLSTMVGNIAYFITFTVPDDGVEVSIMVSKIGDGFFNQPQDANTPQEYIQARRNATEGEVQEFRIGEYDAVSVRTISNEESAQDFTYTITDEWIAAASVTAPTVDLLAQYEPSVVAVLASIQFAVGAAYINSPVLKVPVLPEPWTMGMASQESGFYEFRLYSADVEQLQNAYLVLQIADLEAVGGLDVTQDNLEQILFRAAGQNVEFETLTVGGYTVLRTADVAIEGSYYVSHSLILSEGRWLFLGISQTPIQDDMTQILTTVDTIITDMEITLPGD